MIAADKRDNDYYARQLKRRHPIIYADYLAGKYGSLREALIASGIRKTRTPLHELKNAWRKASKREQLEFVSWIRGRLRATAATTGTARPSGKPIAIDRRLEPWAAARVRTIMATRGLKIGDVMGELGFSRRDASLGGALSGGNRLRSEVLDELEQWLDTNSHV